MSAFMLQSRVLHIKLVTQRVVLHLIVMLIDFFFGLLKLGTRNVKLYLLNWQNLPQTEYSQTHVVWYRDIVSIEVRLKKAAWKRG